MYEGWHILTNENGKEYIWIVKGYEQPEGGFISIPYRISGLKVKSSEIQRVVPKDYFKYLDCIGGYAPVVDRDKIVKYYDPSEMYFKKESILPLKIKELVDYLSPSYIGLIGSYAFGFQSEKSDVDLVLYGNNRELYEKLLELKNEGKINNCINRFNKVSDTMSYNEYVIFSKIRVLDSCYENVPYTIRILRQTNSKKCESIFKTISEFRGIIEIYDNKENFLVPSVYTGRSENYGKLEIVTWHTRYSELPLGKYHIEGKLQLDIKTNKIIVVPDLGGKIDPIEIWS